MERTSVPGLHDAEGLAIAGGIRPLDASGAPSADGRYALVSIGRSNTTQEFSEFKRRADQDPATHPRLTIVDSAKGGQTADDWANSSCNCWSVLDQRLTNAGVGAPQVAAAWIKMANRQPSTGFPTYAQQLASSTETVLRSLRQRFPNLQLAYLSSRIYAGYATTTLNPEPHAYESAFSVRWVIDRQLNGALNYSHARGAVQAPWLSWGPDMWADGLTPRADGPRGPVRTCRMTARIRVRRARGKWPTCCCHSSKATRRRGRRSFAESRLLRACCSRGPRNPPRRPRPGCWSAPPAAWRDPAAGEDERQPARPPVDQAGTTRGFGAPAITPTKLP